MSMFKMPEMVNRRIEASRAQFFWGRDGTDKKKISWVQWKKVLNSKEKGGLGIGSLKALNLALIQKWRWRFHTDTKGIWKNIITSIYGPNGGFGNQGSISRGNGLWSSIVKAIDQMHGQHIVEYTNMRKSIGNGPNTRLWMDLWVGDLILKERFPRLYALESNKNCTIHDRWGNGQWLWSWLRNILNGGRTCQQLQDMQDVFQPLELNNREDAWKWQLANDGVFSVSCTRKHIDNILLNSGDIATRWNNIVPIKVNILVWRIRLDWLPTRINLIERGIGVPSLLCPSCGNQIEDVSHTFVTCEVASYIWDRVFKWLDMYHPMFSNIEDIFSWVDSLTIHFNRRKCWMLLSTRFCGLFGGIEIARSLGSEDEQE